MSRPEQYNVMRRLRHRGHFRPFLVSGPLPYDIAVATCRVMETIHRKDKGGRFYTEKSKP